MQNHHKTVLQVHPMVSCFMTSFHCIDIFWLIHFNCRSITALQECPFPLPLFLPFPCRSRSKSHRYSSLLYSIAQQMKQNVSEVFPTFICQSIKQNLVSNIAVTSSLLGFPVSNMSVTQFLLCIADVYTCALCNYTLFISF